MQFSNAGMDLLKRSEGFRNNTYLDVAGLPTIGYGHRLLCADSFSNGIDEPQAANLLSCDVNSARFAVDRMVKVPLTQGQYDALVDFTFNLGSGRLAGSTLLKLLNAGNYDAACAQLLLWDHGSGKELPALKARREAEAALWRDYGTITAG